MLGAPVRHFDVNCDRHTTLHDDGHSNVPVLPGYTAVGVDDTDRSG